jgi:cytochrome c-type biogenesis protein CcmF
LVRSGVLSSVHAFAVDPARGMFILALLVLYCGGAFTLYALRAPTLKTLRLFTPISRESSLVANNLVLVTMAATILTGTLYPLVMDAMNLGQISVGPPYYNATVVRLAVPLFILMGIGPFLPWKRPGRWAFKTPLIACALITIAAMLFIPVHVFGFGLGIWLMVASAGYAIQNKINARTISLVLGHFGMGLAVIGMLGTTVLKHEDIRVVKPGDKFTVGSYDLVFKGVKDIFGPNYGAYEATITLPGDTLKPQKRWYPVSDSETTEAAIRLHSFNDLYVVLGDRDIKAGPDSWVVRTTIHPFVSALWGGFIMIVLAGIAMLRGRR